MIPDVLLRRATFGPTPELRAQAGSVTASDWLDAHLAGPQDSSVGGLAARFPVLTRPTADFVARSRADHRLGNADQMRAVNQLQLARAVWSAQQVHERMLDFWSNHLNVTCPSDRVWAVRADYDRVIRAQATGSFRQLLQSAVKHPAMLVYLNNDVSSKASPNENLGRELLELHTVGISAGYTEADVVNSARILTGLGTNGDTHEFVYRPGQHWTGPVRVLGFSDPNESADGRGVVDAYLSYLARHPATAERVATKLCQYFVSDNPPVTLVARMGEIYRRNDTSIGPVVREMFLSSEFNAPGNSKFRRPAEQVYAAIRTLGVQPSPSGIKGIDNLYGITKAMGNEPNAWPAPDGYPTSAEEWSSAGATLTRMNAVTGLAHGWIRGLSYPPVRQLLPKPLPADHAGLVSALYKRLHYRPMQAGDVSAVCSFLRVKGPDPLTESSPVLNPRWDLPQLVGVLLNAPVLATY